jgi:signal transduction histidine kinase
MPRPIDYGTREALNAMARLPKLASILSRYVCIMASIQAIEQTSVHQIQSGQVIVDLNSVVKELVENSLDAGSTSIEVRFRNHGLDAIEVIDNGTGIAPEDFDSVGMFQHSGSCACQHLTRPA